MSRYTVTLKLDGMYTQWVDYTVEATSLAEAAEIINGGNWDSAIDENQVDLVLDPDDWRVIGVCDA